jgi:hypothetical protein
LVLAITAQPGRSRMSVMPGLCPAGVQG